MRKFSTSAVAALVFALLFCGSAIAQSIDLQMNGISDNPTDITLGQGNVVYSLGIYNATGSSTATNVIVLSTLPASSSYVSSSASGSGSCSDIGGGQVSCTWPTLNAFSTATATITVTPGAGGTNTFTSVVSGDQTDPTPANNTESETTVVNATIDLLMNGISDSPTDITLGQGNVTYTLSTYNSSTSKATNTVLTINLPASSTYVSSSTNLGGTCSESTPGVVTCNWAVHNAFNSPTTTVVVTPGTGGTNTLSASYASSDQGDHVPANNTESETTTVNATIDLLMNGISDSPTDITLGQGNVTYSISTYNSSTSKATNTVLTLTLPASSTFVSASANVGGTCSETTPGTVTCNWAVHNAFTSPTTTLVITPGAGGANTLNASYASTDQGDPNNANNTESETTTVNATIDLLMNGIGDSPTDITLGQGDVTYSISTYNSSTSKATNTVLTLTLPASSTFVSASANLGGTCSETTPGTVTCNWAVHNAFNSPTTTLVITPGVGGTNTLNASYASTDQGDPNNANNTESETTTVNATIDLLMNGISDSPTDITLGQGNVTYTISTYNSSTSKATNTVLTLTLPASSTFVSASATLGGTCSETTPGTVTCNWATHNAFNSPTTTLVITPGAGGTNTLNASYASSDQGDPNNANNAESEGTTVNATIDLQMNGISDTPTDITLGQGNVTYTINTYNASTSKGTNTVLTLTLPASSTFVSASANLSGTCSESTPGVVTCNWAVHNAFNSPTTTLVITPGAGGTNTLNASYASSDQGDPNNANNTESEGTTVNATIDLQMNGVNDNPTAITLGQGNVTYTLNTYNASTSKATNTVLTLTLPASSTFVSASANLSGTCSESTPGVVTCNWATHNAFTSPTITLVVTPGAGGTNTLGVSYASSDQGDHVPANNTDSETTTVNATLDLSVSMTDAPDPRVLAAGNVTYSVAFTNNTNSKATNPVLNLALDPTVSYVSSTPSAGGTCTPGTNNVSCTWVDIPGSSSKTLTVVVTPTQVGQISATITATADQGDHVPGNNSETDTTNINPGSAPTITSFSPTSGPVGTTVSVTGSNFFSSTAVKFNGTNSTFTVNTNGSITATVPGGATTGPVSITNSVGTTTGGTFTVTPAPDLTIVKTASAATVATSSGFSYFLDVSNTGAGSAADVTVTDTLPAGVTFSSFGTNTGWSCSGTTAITCTHGSLGNGQSAATITINVTAPASGTTVVNTGTVSSTTPDANGGNNSSNVSVGVVGCPANPVVTYPATVCANTTGHTASIPPVPTATYLWTVIGGNGSITSANNGTGITFDAGTADPLSIQVDVFVTACPTATSVITIDVSTPVATITPSGPTTFCAPGSVTLNASNGSSWLWSNGATTQSVVISATETLTVAVTDAAGCVATSAPTTVTVNAPPTATITPSGPTTFCTGGQVTLFAPGGMTNYLWSNGATSSSILVTSTGSYSVTITDASGCTDTSAPTAVTVNAPPDATVTPDGPTNFCAGGQVVLSAPAGMSSYLWSNAATSPSITVTASGSFSVTVTDANGCSATSAVTNVAVSPAPAASITASGPTTFCAGGSVTLTANSGMTGYLWSTGATTQQITVSAGGTYSVTVTDGSGCSATSSPVTVTVNAAPGTTITPSGPTTFCTGGSVTLSAPGGMTSYLWSNGATTPAINVNATGSFSVTVTDSNGCSATSAPTAVTVTSPTPATITPSGPTTFCAGGSVTLSAPAGMTSYAWSNGATTPSITVSTTSSHTVTIVNPGGCSSTSSPTSVSVLQAAPATITASGPTSFCPGGNVTLTASAGASYLWSNGATTPSINVTTSGSFSVTVTDGNGCSATSAATNVTVTPSPLVIIAGPTATCPSSAVVLDAGSGFASYAWSTGATTQQINVTPAVDTTYSVTVTDANGCSAGDSHTVTISPSPTATITAPAAVCAGGNGSADVPSQPGATYAWTITGGLINGSSNGSTVNFIAQNTTQVLLGVTVTSGACTSAGNVTIPINPPPAVVITAPTTVDASTSGHTASVTPTPGATYVWSISNGSITAGAGTPNLTFSAGTASPITLTVSATVSGCTSTNSVLVDVASSAPPLADLSVTKSAPASVQAGATFTYTITVTNHGPSASQNASIVDPLPAGVTFQSLTDGLWSCAVTGAQMNCSGNVPPGSSTIALVVQAPSQAGPITNTVTVNANVTPDPNSANNTASVTTTVVLPSPVCATVPPSLTSPGDGASVNSPATFEWLPVANAVSYDLWITNEGATTLAGSTAATSLTRPVSSGTSTWFVVANLGTGCTALTSAQRTFVVAPSSTCINNGRPQLTGPAGPTQTSPVIFSWTGVPNAISYRVWIEVDGTPRQDLGTTDGALSLSAVVPPGSVVAYVDATFSACPATRSEPIAFIVLQPDPCAGRTSAALLAPANNALINSSSVEMSWTEAAHADGYRVWASVDGAAPAVIGETNETSLRTTFERGEVIWFVQALYDGCAATESPRSRFTIPARNECSNDQPQLVSPVNRQNVSDANVTFDWNAVNDAIGYEVWLGLDNGTPTLIGTTDAATTALTHLVPPGELSWFVRALIDRCPGRNSQAERFAFTPPAACEPNHRPLLSAPLDGASLAAPVDFDWNDPGASRYELYVIRGTGAPTMIAGTTASELNDVALATGNYRWFVRAFFGQSCAPLDSIEHTLEVVPLPTACAALQPPVVSAPGQISSAVPFVLQWTPVAGATSYQLQLSSSESFEPNSVITTTATEHELLVTTSGATTRYARVRAIDGRCTPLASIGAFGPVSAIFIIPANTAEGSAPLGDGGPVTFVLPLGAELAGQTFTAIPTQPWLTVAPASGVVPAGGITLTVTANTAGLPPGTSLGAITVNLNAASGRVKTDGTSVTLPFGVSLVTPVTPTPKNTPPPDALVIPAVANADGIGSHFQSDVRVSNTSAQLMKYQLSFIPSGEGGIGSGHQTTFTIEPGRTVALDDILKTWFGTGTTNATGSLEVRPLTAVAKSTSGAAVGALANIVTFASSRMFNATPAGTFGQYIPAIPFANFIGKSASGGPAILSLQQIAQSDKYRTNLGFVEASGESASLLVSVFGATGQKLTEFPVNLNGGQHTQLNGVLSQHGITSLDDGRVEVQVVGGNGKITAYASVLDNKTADPLLVSPVTLSSTGNTKWVVPGVADLASGFANWQSDVRVFNAGTVSTDLALTFVSQNGGEPKSMLLTLGAGEVRQLDRVLSLFGVAQDGGALHIATPTDARLIATARTYNLTTQGTYGQFIPAVTPAESVALGSRPLQLLQVEESTRYRSNIGFAEVTGNPVKLEVSIVPPDAKFTATVQVDLGPNEFRQINSMLAGLGIGEIYNARVSVRVISGNGRATTYASVIDAKTNDPTYVPAQ